MHKHLIAILVLAVSGCQGIVGGSGNGGGSGGGTGSTSSGLCAPVTMPALARLTRTQYQATLRDLVGVDIDVTTFPPDDDSLGFAVGATTSALLVKRYAAAAETAAKQADLGTVVGCAASAPQKNTPQGNTIDEKCAREMIVSFGRRAFREPVKQDVADRLIKLYREAVADGQSAEDALRLVLRAMLQSPRLVYRRQRPEKQRAYSVAARLSYFLWGAPPDEALLSLAEKGGLDKGEQIAQQARVMLADKRADRAIADFFRQWLQLDRLDAISKDENTYPGFDSALAASMKRETEAFVHEVLRSGDGKLRTLLTGGYTFVDARLAAHYGIDIGADKSPSVAHRVELDASRRAGLLTHASFLAINANTDQSSPIRRGKFVRERLLCQDLPAPPDNVAATPPDPDPSLPTRQRFEEHRKDPSCKSCHQLMDPIGFGFERYDGVGRYRDTEAGKPIDDSGSLVDTVDLDGDFRGVPDLAKKLAESAQVQRCMVKQWFRYAFGRRESGFDACAIREAQKRFAAADGDLRELIVAIATLLAEADASGSDPAPSSPSSPSSNDKN
ncbi:MAG: DUF1592 domain-containing protein [Myxococcales bacterium]|nr:DUF1592 domain-containing protein [Myxococcales bacterium]